jgi:iron(III) transport system substrate-binding protein
MQQYVTALRLEYGDDTAREWLEGMVANDAVDFPDNVSIRDSIASGEIDVGLLNHYYVAQAVAAEGEDYPVKLFYPSEGLGSLLLLTSVGVLESSERKEEAFDFVRSLLSKEGQEFFTATSKEYPMAIGAKLDPSLEVPLEDIPAPKGNLSDISETQATIELMQDAGAL